MTDRDRLIKLKRQAVNYAQEKADERGGLVCIDDEVDYLLANGVKLSAELQNKCGSCIYAKPIVAFGKSKCYVNCTNKEHIERFCQREISTLRQRTHPACKKYEECEGK